MKLKILRMNNQSKVITFIILIFFFIKNYFKSEFYDSIFLIKFIYPVFMIMIIYFAACLFGEFINSLSEHNKKSSRIIKKNKDIDVWLVIFTRIHLYILWAIFVFLPILLFGRKYGGLLSFTSSISVVIILFGYYWYYKNKLKISITKEGQKLRR